MKHFELRPAFLIGHKKIDQEHAELVKMLNNCIDIANANGERAEFSAAFSAFEKAVRQHIIDEEVIMSELGYLETNEDAAIHQESLRIFRELSDDCKTSVDMEGILKQTVAALLEQMLKADLGLKGHLQNIDYHDD